MKRYKVAFCLPFLFLSHAFAAESPALTLFDAAKTPLENVQTQDVVVEKQGNALLVRTGVASRWPGIQLNGPWKLQDYGSLVLEIENRGDADLKLHCRLDNPGGDGATGIGTYTRSVHVPAQGRKRWTLNLPVAIPEALREKFFAMRGHPFSMDPNGEGSEFDRTTVSELRLFLADPKEPAIWALRSIIAEPGGEIGNTNVAPEKFFPMIDTFGQYMHKDWSGKIKSEADLKSRIATEAADLQAHPGPKSWNRYGGWTAGPQLRASGHFRTEKVGEKWWLVDPEGRLFWSHGVDCVADWGAVNPITDREFYFADLPGPDSPRARFYGKDSWSPHNYYEGRGEFKTFNWTASNLFRKYGDDWREKFADISHKRLRSWGMNTIANWSSDWIEKLHRTPYTATVGASHCPTIEASEGYWGKFVDPFHPEFRRKYRGALEAQRGSTAEDPWCIGYFIDNEMSWGDERSLTLACLASPAKQPAKIALRDWLREKYEGSIDKLNTAWGTQYADWDDFLSSHEKPQETAEGDLRSFYTVIAEQYFKVLSEELKRVAPEKLYLGCRFAWGNELAIRAAAKYVDVISFNIYKYEIGSFHLPEGVDRPCLIGEFHFGALDRGLFHTGLGPVDSQEERAAAYKRYVRSALTNPIWVGTHWFQYGDQATTGRPDGENYQIGLLDVCDSPYPETIDALREIGYRLYEIRAEE